MKKYLALTIASIAFVALLATTAHAQTSNSQVMRARVPFAFNVGRTELPAGEYNVTVLNPSSDRKVLQIRSIDGRVSAIVNTLSATAHAPDQSKLVFRRYGEKYFFAQAQVSGESTALAALKSGAERTEERMIAGQRSKATVTIAAE